MRVPIYQVDAFTDRPFAGNPAAVVLLREPAADAWMQTVAAEMNLSETAFLLPEGDGYRLRWFTPSVEVSLCGHATLASAHVLFAEGYLQPDAVARFATKSGLLTVARRDDWLQMDFPARPVGPVTETPAALAAALGASPRQVHDRGRGYLVLLESEEAVQSLKPDWAALTRVTTGGIIVTAQATTPGYDFCSRFFAPGIGIPEDPVTGSAHCALGPYWAARLGKSEMMARQVSRRGGVLRVRVAGDRVYLGGQAVTILRGELSREAVSSS